MTQGKQRNLLTSFGSRQGRTLSSSTSSSWSVKLGTTHSLASSPWLNIKPRVFHSQYSCIGSPRTRRQDTICRVWIFNEITLDIPRNINFIQVFNAYKYFFFDGREKKIQFSDGNQIIVVCMEGIFFLYFSEYCFCVYWKFFNSCYRRAYPSR